MTRSVFLTLFCLALISSACGSAPPSKQDGTAPLRSGKQIAESVGNKTREVNAKNKDLTLYATSIDEDAEATQPEPAKVGRITVYSKPKGSIMLDGEATNIDTPGSIDAPTGKHELQVTFENGETSEIKAVRVREGSRVKLFFRQASQDPDPPETSPDTPETPEKP